MLTLIEPPVAKRGRSVVSNRSAQHLLQFSAAVEDDDFDENESDPSDIQRSGRRTLLQMLDSLLVGTSSSAEYSLQWKREFSQRPSWCDADMALQQIKRGKAQGNKIALYSRSLIQKSLFHLGSFVQQHAVLVILTVLVLFSFCCYGLQYVRIETDIVKLWVAQGGRLDEELNFLSRVQEDSGSVNMKRESGLGGGYQVVIQVPRRADKNILTRDGLLEHVSVMKEIAEFRVEVAGENWTLADICFKPPTPEVSNQSMGANYIKIIDQIIPCVWITPIDCFWEGAKALGPHPPVNASDMATAMQFMTSLPSKDTFSWADINPQLVMEELNEFFNLGNLDSFFKRAQIGSGYLDRWCIDPLDHECPVEAPNHFRFCDLIPKFLSYAAEHNFEVPVDPEFLKWEEAKKLRDAMSVENLFGLFGRKKRETKAYDRSEKVLKDVRLGSSVHSPMIPVGNESASPSDHTIPSITAKLQGDKHQATSRSFVQPENTTLQIPSSSTVSLLTPATKTETEDPFEVTLREQKTKATRCRKYARPFADWMRANHEKWKEFLNEEELPVFPDYGQVLSEGCHGFARGVMSWPQDLIVGGIGKSQNGKIQSAQALQSVFLVSSPNDVYLRFKDNRKRYLKKSLNSSNWNIEMAQKVISTWQRNFTHNLYNHKWNFELDTDSGVYAEHRRIHPLASTSIADMLEEFCQFNYTIIFIGYFLMLVYAMHAQMKCHGCLLAVDSCMGLAFAGVVTVTFASISGLGLATWFGIEFNAATTQIVPFLTLGIGVDNMFLLLHNYHGILENVNRNEIGELMKETGMSVVMSSVNNILSFLAGTVLPIPALRSFCAQSSVLLSFNLIAILTIYPAIISIDLQRRKRIRRDICCWAVATEATVSSEDSFFTKPQIQEKKTIGANESSYNNLYACAEPTYEIEDEVKPWTLQAFLRNYYVPLLSKDSSKLFILFFCSLMLLASLRGMYDATYGLELSDVLPDNTAPAAFLKARDRYFSFYPMFAVLKGPGIDYARSQHIIDRYRMSIGKSKYVVKLENGEPSEKYWLSLMRTWLRNLQLKLDEAIEKKLIDPVTGQIIGEPKGYYGWSSRLSSDVNIAYRLACNTRYAVDCAGRVGKIRLVDESGIINIDGFYNYLTAWYNLDSMMYHVSQASFIPAPPTWTMNNDTLFIPPAGPMSYSQIPFYLTGLTNTPIIVKMIKEIRAICDEFDRENLPNFPSGIAFTFWEQYLHLSTNLMHAIAIIAVAVFLVLSVITCNPWAAGIIMMILVLITVELAGFLGLAGIKLNPISAVTIITAVGIGVEFTAHVVLSFLTSLGTRNDRMAACIERVFVPVIHGALSTLLGIVMLAFSEFEFVVKYFFVVMTALIAVGIINGLFLLPVLLSLIGPPCEVSPIDGTDRLDPPPPVRRKLRKRQAQEMQTHRRNDSDDSNTGTLGLENCSTMLLIDPSRGGITTPRLSVNSHARSASAHITS